MKIHFTNVSKVLNQACLEGEPVGYDFSWKENTAISEINKKFKPNVVLPIEKLSYLNYCTTTHYIIFWLQL